MTTDYAELAVTTNFTFLTGASHPEEMMERASELGLKAIAITDRNTLAGVVRAFTALREMKREADNIRKRSVTNKDVRERAKARSKTRLDPSSRQAFEDKILDQEEEAPVPADQPIPQFIVGCHLVLEDSLVTWNALPTTREAYARLCRLLTLGKRRAEKGKCILKQADLLNGAEDILLLAHPPDPIKASKAEKIKAEAHIKAVINQYPGNTYLGSAPRYDGHDRKRLAHHAAQAAHLNRPMVAIGDAMMHHGNRRRLVDVLTCIREGLTIDKIGASALPNAERRLKSASEMARIFQDYPEALAETLTIAGRCHFSLDDLKYEYPDEVTNGQDPDERLEQLTREGLANRYPHGVPETVTKLATKELALIARLGFARYFLTVYDTVTYARSIDILCQGRGSAANSVICFALAITEVGPEQISMVFERFVSEARNEPPDIDVDFEHERREEVIQYIYNKFGRHRAGLCATVSHYRARGAIREVGKIMGLSQDVLSAISGQIWGWSNEAIQSDKIREAGLDPTDRRLRQTLQLISQIIGFPRHLGQHVGGFIMTRGRLDELCPIENAAMQDRTVIEWDKDDIDALGILKVDVLSLGMLTCLRKCFHLLQRHDHIEFDLDTLPREDPKIYDMLEKADAIGVFQVESRAQMNFLPRMKPRCFYDLVIEVAIIRPGPIQGDMVHPYLRRRRGEEAVDFPSKELEGVLGKTLGVPLFQEQAMQVAIIAAGFTPDEADRLRRSLATFRRMGTITSFRERFISGMLERGYEPDFAERCFSQIEGFGEYGFPESHAASFAPLVYASSWFKCHHPAIFACALLNSQPMGFYAPAQIIRDAREHGVEIRPISANASEWDNKLEPDRHGSHALRLGLRQIKGFREDEANWLVAARGNGYADPETLWRRAGLQPRSLVKLAEADAFTDMGLERRDALWAVKAIKTVKPLPLFEDAFEGERIIEPQVHLPPMSLGEAVYDDYVTTRFSLRAHPLDLLREKLRARANARENFRPHNEMTTCDNGVAITVAGLVITRQRPGTASGVIFITLEDETGVSNVIVWPKIYETFRKIVISGRLLKVHGVLQREGPVTHIIARRIEDHSTLLEHMAESIEVISDEAAEFAVQKPPPPRRAMHPREQAKRLFPSRDFH